MCPEMFRRQSQTEKQVSIHKKHKVILSDKNQNESFSHIIIYTGTNDLGAIKGHSYAQIGSIRPTQCYYVLISSKHYSNFIITHKLHSRSSTTTILCSCLTQPNKTSTEHHLLKPVKQHKSSQITFIYKALYTIQIVPKQIYSVKQENSVSIMQTFYFSVKQLLLQPAGEATLQTGGHT